MRTLYKSDIRWESEGGKALRANGKGYDGGSGVS